jgi:ribonuclease Z
MAAPARPHFFPGEPLAAGAMRVTLLGTGTPFPRRGQASAGVLVEAGAHRLLLDMGSGVPANLAALEIPFAYLDKVILTHHHVDHIGGLDELWIGGWTYGRRTPLNVWGPPGTAEIARHLQAIYGWDIETRRRVFETLEGSELNAVDYRAGVVFEQGGLTVTAFEVVHTPPHNSYGLRIDFAGRSMVFSGDTKRCDALIDHARGVDLLIHEAFPPAAVYAEKAGRPLALARVIAEDVHTAPGEAGAVFAAAGPGLAVIYHMYNNADVIAPALDEIRRAYGGPVEIGYDLMVIDIDDRIRVRPAVVSDKPWPVRPPAKGDEC